MIDYITHKLLSIIQSQKLRFRRLDVNYVIFINSFTSDYIYRYFRSDFYVFNYNNYKLKSLRRRVISILWFYM